MQVIKLFVFYLLLFNPLDVLAQNEPWNKDMPDKTDSQIIESNVNRIKKLPFDTILQSIGGRKLVLLGDQRHDVWNLITAENFIVQSFCRKQKVNFLHEGSIYQFYYNNAVQLHKTGYRIGGFDYHDIYFGITVGDDLLDSLGSQKTIDSIFIYGNDYITINIPELKLLYNDLITDLELNKKLQNRFEIDTGFIKQLITTESVFHFAVEDFKYRQNTKKNIALIDQFYDSLLHKSRTTANKFKKRMWRCVYQSTQYLYAQKDMNLEKAKAFDLEEMTKESWILRDKFLYENTKWYLDEILDTSLVTLISISSAHAIKSVDFSESVSKKIDPVYRSLGMLLKNDPATKSKLFSISIIPVTGYHGRAINYYDKLPMPPKKSTEYKIATTEPGIAYYDLNKGPSEFVMHPFANDLYIRQDWKPFYDGVIFIKDVIPNFFSKADYGKRRRKN